MDLETYNKRIKNIKSTHPAPDGLDGYDCNKYYRSIISGWQSQLSDVDRRMVQKAENDFAYHLSL